MLFPLVASCAGGPRISGEGAFAGLAAADEPQAVAVARGILEAGGSAADAAIGAFFALSVTYPSRVGLGGGGGCVVFESASQSGEAFAFLPRPLASGALVPVTVRAMAAMHARYGKLRWARLVSPAEVLARFGQQVSRAFADDLAAAEARIGAAPTLARVLLGPDGWPLGAGATLVQGDLAGLLAAIRRSGPEALAGEPFATRWQAAWNALGHPMAREELRGGVPQVGPTLAVPAGNYTAHFLPLGDGDALAAPALWRLLSEIESYDRADEGAERAHLLAEAAWRAYDLADDGQGAAAIEDERLEAEMADYSAERHAPGRRFTRLAAGQGSSGQGGMASLVVGDTRSNAVACAFTMGAPFGAARMADGSGVILPTPASGQPPLGKSLAAVVVGNRHTGDVRFAGAAGGEAAAAALIGVMLETVEVERPLEEALGAARLGPDGASGRLRHEAALDQGAREGLAQRGHDLQQVDGLGRVNAFYCARGLKDRPGSCRVGADPRGRGLAWR